MRAVGSLRRASAGDPVTTLYRVAESLAVRDDGTGRTVYGLAVPYGVTAQVNDGAGPYKERLAPGVFTRSIAERGHKIKLFVQHEVRRLPIGKATELREAGDGLHAAFGLPRTRDADEAIELVTSGVVHRVRAAEGPPRGWRHGPGRGRAAGDLLRSLAGVRGGPGRRSPIRR
jgi:Caudovirus prohead serine protease